MTHASRRVIPGGLVVRSVGAAVNAKKQTMSTKETELLELVRAIPRSLGRGPSSGARLDQPSPRDNHD